ncbi:MAG: hypothetical protein JWR08_1697 [Enterovirga sp.]|jgi:membrane protein|nr:hypothetical protein [Enterovirga sp.]
MGRRPSRTSDPDRRDSESPGAKDRSAADPHAAGREPGRGRQASTPERIPARGWWDIGWRVYGEIGDDRVLAVAAGVTFYGLLAIFPAIGAFVSLYGLVADPSTISEHLNALSGFLPGGAIEIVGDQVKRITGGDETALGVAFFSGLGVSLWSANAGVKAIFDALNVAYEEKEKRNFFVLNLTSLAFTLGGVLFLVVALSSVVVVPVVLKFIGLGGGIMDWLIWIGRWPLLLAVTLFAVAALYRYGPSRDRAQWRWLAPGSLLATIGWMAFSMLFSWYVSSFGSYNETYGSLGAVVGLMTWMWLSATILLVGAELNAETEHQTAEDTTEGPAQPLGTRGAQMADNVGKART